MKYNIYVFLDQRGKPYYVGKTNNFKRRRREHLEEIKTMNPLPKYKKARRLLKNGGKFRMRTVAQTLIEKDAYEIERFYIKKYSNAGHVLTNVVHNKKKSPTKKKVVKHKRKKHRGRIN